jgi:hypothetical protein
MAFDATRFLFSRALIEREGVATSDATRLAVLPSIVQMPLAQSVLLATSIGRREAPPSPAVQATAGLVKIPQVQGQRLDEAVSALEGKGLAYAIERGEVDTAGAWKVLSADPAPGTEVAAGSQVTLTVAVQSKVPAISKRDPQTMVDALVAVGLAGVIEGSGNAIQEVEPAPGTPLLVGTKVSVRTDASQGRGKGSSGSSSGRTTQTSAEGTAGGSSS